MIVTKIFLPILDPNKAYRDRWLWLPKKKINQEWLKSSLTLVLDTGDEVPMWTEAPNHVGVPREFMSSAELSCEVVDLTPSFPTIEFESSVQLDRLDPTKPTQNNAFTDLVNANRGILNLACGAGKTVIVLHAIAQWREPTLIIAHQEQILEQWRAEINRFLRFDGEIGWIQGPPDDWDWKHPITLGMIRSLATYGTQMPQEMDRWFGRIVWDECFVAGTLVNGIPIEQVAINDSTVAYDPETGMVKQCHIASTRARHPSHLVSVYVADEVLTCTPNHPFWTQRGWVPAIELTNLDMVLCCNHEQKHLQLWAADFWKGHRKILHQSKEGQIPSWVWVDGIEIHQQTSDGTFGGRCPGGLVYNLEVVDTPTYMVGRQRTVVHNCHHIPAREFSKTAALFVGKRYGATATVNRTDGTEDLYLFHVGPVIHSNLTQDVKPKVFFLASPVALDLSNYETRKRVSDRLGELHIRRLCNYVSCLPEELDFVEKHLKEALKAGRKILALSLSVEQLVALHERFPEGGLIIGAVKQAQQRLDALQKQLCFGTTDLAREALNERSLDALFILTEFSNPNMLQQAVGRVQRMMDGKKQPKVIVVHHVNVKPMAAMAKKLRRYFYQWGFKVEDL